MKAVLCPVCNGTGKYNEAQCHGCDGRGWVEVQEDPITYTYTAPLFRIEYPWHNPGTWTPVQY